MLDFLYVLIPPQYLPQGRMPSQVDSSGAAILDIGSHVFSLRFPDPRYSLIRMYHLPAILPSMCSLSP